MQLSKMIRKERLGFVGVIKTKKFNMDLNLVRRIWGLDNCDWSAMDAQGTSGGILYNWENSFVKLDTIVKGRKWICIKGFINELNM